MLLRVSENAREGGSGNGLRKVGRKLALEIVAQDKEGCA